MFRLSIIAAFYGSYFAFVGLYSPFLGPYLKNQGHSLGVIALALGMMQGMRIVGPFFWGWVADHSGRLALWIRLGSLGGLLFSIVAMSHVDSAFLLVASILCLNLFVSGLVPLSDTFAMNACQGHPGLYGKVRLFGSAGFVLAVLGFGAWAEIRGYDDYPYWMWAALCLTFLFAMLFEDPKEDVKPLESQSFDPVTGSGLKLLLMPTDLRLFWLASFFMIFAHGIFYSYFSLYLQEYNYKESTIGLLWAIGVVFEIVFFWYQGRLYPRLTHLQWLNLAFAACVCRFALLAIFPELLWILFVAQAGHCLTFAAHHTATVAWLRSRLNRKLVARGQAMYATLAYGFGGSLGTLTGKFFWDGVSPSAAFGLAAVAALFACVAGWRLSNLQGSSSGQSTR